MKYSDTSFNKNGAFGLIRVTFSSLFLAPFRLVESISLRIVFLPTEAINKMLAVAVVFNTIVTGVTAFNDYTSKSWSIWSSSIGLVQCGIAYLVIALAYVLFKFKNNLSLNLGTKPVESDLEEPGLTNSTSSDNDVRNSIYDKSSRINPKDMVDDEDDFSVNKEESSMEELTDLLNTMSQEGDIDEDTSKEEEIKRGYEALEKITSFDPFDDGVSYISDSQSKEDKELNKHLMDKAVEENKEFIEKQDEKTKDMMDDFADILSRMNVSDLPN